MTTIMTRKYLWLVLCAALLLFAACQKAPELTITSPSSIELSADGSSGSITFTANRDWKASSSDSWVTVSPSSGEASDKAVTVSVRCNSNTTYDDRTATVTIRMEELSKTVSVRQPANKGVVLPKQTFDLQAETRSIDVEVQANVQYTVSTSVNWIKQTGTKGLTSKTLTFSIEENKTYDSREGKITIKPQESGVQEQVISVRQAQKDALVVEKTSYDMPYGGGEVEIKVEANVSFDVTPSADWVHYIQTKALSNSTVVLKIDENTTYSPRQGTVEIKQQNGNLKHTITINEAGQIAVTSVELNKAELKLEEGASETLTATVKPDNATDKTVAWSSSDNGVAKVDTEGKVTAIKAGSATITAKAGDKSTTCSVTVFKEIPVTSINLNKISLSLVAGNEASLSATVKPDDATDKAISWSSSNDNIATVSAEGKVKAVAKGNAVITAKAGNASTTCKVFVKAANYPTPSGAVDLGLSVIWGEKNLGASSAYDTGGYYLWGDAAGSGVIMFFETPNTDYIYDTKNDIAKAQLGKGWRLPTREEIKEMLMSCDWEKISNGVKLTGPSGNSIVLPLTGMGFPADGPAGSMSITSKDKGYLMTGESYADGSTRFAYVYHYNQSFTYNWSSYNAPMAKFPVRPVFESLDGTIPVSSITLNKTELKLKEGASETLIATVLPSDATDKSITWSSSDSSVATVDINGKVTAISAGSANIMAVAGEKKATCSVLVSSVQVPSGAVDLGIVITREDGSTYLLFWAKCNIGASKPEEYGDYFSWGEIEPKTDYSMSAYKWWNPSSRTLTKYNTYAPFGIVDNKTVLDPEDDVAHIKLGDKWRMPTEDEWAEFYSNCTLTWTSQNGVNGCLATSKINGNSVFLPASGYWKDSSLKGSGSSCAYWTSSLKVGGDTGSWSIAISSGGNGWSYGSRAYGLSVRPVSE